MLKTKNELLKMNKKELNTYKRSEEIKESFNKNSLCINCSHCTDCSYCSGCSHCTDCFNCRNVKGLKYAICNMEVGKETYFNKMKELKD